MLLGVVVNNLLLNALRYGPRTGGDVRIRARRERARWRISVTSQGPASRPRTAPASSSPTPAERTNAAPRAPDLAWRSAVSIVERHGGIIGVAPVRAGGNRFYFTIPATRRPTKPAPRTPTS